MNYSFCLLLLFTFGNLSEGEKLKLSIYYEVLCSDSRDFIRDQLYPAYQKLENSLNLKFVPFGKSKVLKNNTEINFKCHHGHRECRGNMLHACVLNEKIIQNKEAHFVHCSVTNRFPASPITIKDCALAMGIDGVKVDECMESKGKFLLAHMGKLTQNLEPKLFHVPTITVNDFFNFTLMIDLEYDFFKTICQLFKEKPVECLST